MLTTMALLLAGNALQAAPFQANPAPALPPGQTIVVDGQKKHWDPQRIVCKSLDQPGSRLNTKRVCQSMLQWAASKREDQQLLIEKQYNGAP
ncbi:MAG TPA: hypothetical protein VGC56_16480 [Allosphingosinicella sp.]|jgi:hypothetical protein